MILMCTLPYELPEHRIIAGDVWTYLLRTFQAAELSATDRHTRDVGRSLQEDR